MIHIQSSGREEVTGANVLVAIFSERESHAAFFLQEQDMTRYDAVNFVSHGITKNEQSQANIVQNIEFNVNQASQGAPEFLQRGDRLRYVQDLPPASFDERKNEVADRLELVLEACRARDNSEALIGRAVDKYANKLKVLTPSNGLYPLLLIGLELTALVQLRQTMPVDEDNPTLDLVLNYNIHSLLLAHAGLMSIFPDAERNSLEIDAIRGQALDLQTSQEWISPLISSLSQPHKILDKETEELTREIGSSPVHSRVSGLFAAKVNWLKGSLSAMARVLLAQVGGVAKSARDAVVKESISEYLRANGGLTTAILAWLGANQHLLLGLADSFASSFGWVRPLFHMLGIG